jgi:hypothetical protein
MTRRSDEELKAELAAAVARADGLAETMLAGQADPVFGPSVVHVSKDLGARYAATVALARSIRDELVRRRDARVRRFLWLQAAS